MCIYFSAIEIFLQIYKHVACAREYRHVFSSKPGSQLVELISYYFQGAFGKSALVASGLATYTMLGLGVVCSSLLAQVFMKFIILQSVVSNIQSSH